MIVRSGRVGHRAWYRRAAVMLAAPASRRMVITRLRRLAIMCGPLAVRTCISVSGAAVGSGRSPTPDHA